MNANETATCKLKNNNGLQMTTDKHEAKKMMPRSMKKATLASMAIWCFAQFIAYTQTEEGLSSIPPVSANDVNSITYQKCKDMIAVLKGSLYVGTGFICLMEGRKYLVTNRHVAEDPERLQVYFQDGRALTIPANAKIELAQDRDLVRFEMPNETRYLEIAQEVPDIGEPVEFYGNAGGKSVITMTAGKVLAVGRERIEIDTSIQGGNSGSPLVRTSDGKVIGVTTISYFNRMDDPSKKNTRYDPTVKATREFAVRFTGITWLAMKYGNFLHKVAVKKDLETFLKILTCICGGKQELLLEHQLRNIQFRGGQQFKNLLRDVVKQDMYLRQYREKLILLKKKNNSISISETIDFERCRNNIKKQRALCFQARLKMLQRLSATIKQLDLFMEDKDAITGLIDRVINKYESDNNLLFNGVDNSNVDTDDPSSPLIGEHIP